MSAPQKPTGPPFFVVAAARSGTTLLRVMLDRHHDVAIPGEGHFIPHLWARRDRYGGGGRVRRTEVFLHDLDAHPAFGFWDLPISAVRDAIGDRSDLSFADAIHAAYAAYARKQGKARWADKTPDYIDHLPLLSRLFPEARFVHMVRDGRDVALSTLDLRRFHRHAATCGYFWARQIAAAIGEGRRLGPGRYLELRYEDLLDGPERELERLCTFVGLPYDDAMLQHDEHDLEKLPERFRPIHTRLALPPTKGLRDWRTQMSPREVAEFEAVAGDQLRAAGYDVVGGSPGLATRLRARYRMAGFGARYLRHRFRVRLRRTRRG